MSSILIVSQFFPPDGTVGAKRALRIASHLVRLGWQVRVLTAREGCFNTLDRSLLIKDEGFGITRTHAILPKLWLRRVASVLRRCVHSHDQRMLGEGTPVRRPIGGALALAWDGVFSLPDEWSGWLPFALTAGLLRAGRADIVLATVPSYTNAIVATLLSACFRVPLVLDYRDPWSGLPCRRGAPRWRLPIDRALERACLKRASLVVATTRGIERELSALGAARRTVITNAFDSGLIENVEPTRYDCFTIVYAGTFYGSRSAEPILKALRLLIDRGVAADGRLALRVLGVSGPEVRTLASHLGVESCLEVEGFVPYREALARLKGADILLLVVGKTHSTQVPAKLFDYLGARRFILAIGPPQSEAGVLISDLGAGRAVDGDDVETIASIISERAGMPRSGIDLPPSVARFEARATMEDLDGQLRGLLAPHPNRRSV